jgi:hypothetical protein
VVVLSALALSACSGDDAAPTTTLPPVTIPDPTTSTTATTTTVTTTDPVVATTSTTVAVPTTTITEAAAKQAVIAAAIESWEAFNELMLDPTNDDKLAVISNLSTAATLDRVVEVVAELRQENQRSITNTEVNAQIRPFVETVVIDNAAGFASVEYCNVNSNILVEIVDDTERVVDDTIRTTRERDTFTLIDGQWINDGGEVLETYEGATTCPDEG